MTATNCAMIPARKGSQRLKFKNLALVDGEPLISHVIRSAKESGVFDKVVVNSDAAVFEEIADELDVEFYHRPPELGSSDTKSDEVVYDFLQNHPCENVAWANPISPLQPTAEIREVVTYFTDNDIQSLFTVKEKQVHSLYEDDPVNFSWDGLFAKTQELSPVFPFIYSIMMWNADTFEQEHESNGHAFFCGETGFYSVSNESSLIVKTEEDLQLVDAVMRGRHEQSDTVEYHELVDDLR